MRGSRAPLPVDPSAEVVADLRHRLRGGGIPDAEAFRVKPPAESAAPAGSVATKPEATVVDVPSQKALGGRVPSSQRNRFRRQ